MAKETMNSVLEDNHHPSSVDDMVRNDTPFEGSDTKLPETNPIFGADGKLPVKKISKLTE